MPGGGSIGGGRSVEVELYEGNQHGSAAVGPSSGGKPITFTFHFKPDGSDDKEITLAGSQKLKFDWTP